jgi:hypothetical protein
VPRSYQLPSNAKAISEVRAKEDSSVSYPTVQQLEITERKSALTGRL